MKRIISLIFLFLIILPLFSCSNKKEYCIDTLEGVFDSVAIISAYDVDQDEFQQNAKKVFEMLEYYHKLFDIYNEYSGLNNLCTVNKNPNQEIIVDDELIEFLSYAKTMYYRTNGEMNIAFGAVLSIWHEYRENGIENPNSASLPNIEELNEANKHTDIEKIKIDRTNKTVCLLDEKMSIDVGAIAKGYATEMCAETLEREGTLKGYLLSIGGNVRAIGKKTNKDNFNIGIENPNGDGYLEILSIEETSVVTSGDYQRYYLVNEERFHHIIDKDSLFPKNEFRLVSIITKDSALADALSTAVFNMSFDEGYEYVNNFSDVEAVWVLSDGRIEYSSGFSKYQKK